MLKCCYKIDVLSNYVKISGYSYTATNFVQHK